MEIHDNFSFSQASLQDYVDCPRRFKLKYIKKLSWPSVQAEPVSEFEIYLEKGTVFHRMIQQHILGISGERLSAMINDEELARWWHNYLSGDIYSGEVHPEKILSSRIKGFPIIAKYDLISIEKDKYLIIDWKTSRKVPINTWLSARLQTRVYLYLFTVAGAHLNKGEKLNPDNISMLYWYSNFPDEMIEFHYSMDRYIEDRDYLITLIDTIINDREFILTDEKRYCNYCIYRSLCDRGIEALSIDELDIDIDSLESSEIEFDFDQIGEIEF